MTPYGMNWVLFIGSVILSLLGLGFVLCILALAILYFITTGNWVMIIVTIGGSLFFSGLLYDIWKHPYGNVKK